MIKIAVVGSGISGLGASYYLGKRHHVDLYESDTRIGGHTHTHKIQLEEEINVDSGFIVFNDLNYPNLIQFFNLPIFLKWVKGLKNNRVNTPYNNL